MERQEEAIDKLAEDSSKLALSCMIYKRSPKPISREQLIDAMADTMNSIEEMRYINGVPDDELRDRIKEKRKRAKRKTEVKP